MAERGELAGGAAVCRPADAVLAGVEHVAWRLLRRCAGRSADPSQPPGGFQQRPGQSVHQHRLRGGPGDGRSMLISMDGKGRYLNKYICGEAVAKPQVRGGLPQGLRQRLRGQGRDRWLALGLQRGALPPGARLSNAASGLRRPTWPVEMWTIRCAERLRFLHFPARAGKRGNARLRPHSHRPHHNRRVLQ
jgi:hypothetical protein